MSFYARLCLISCLLLALASPWVIYGAVRSMEKNTNSPTAWVPATFQERIDYERFLTDFENGDLAVVSWEGCTLDDERLAKFGHLVYQGADAAGQPFFSRVLTGPYVLDELMTTLKLSRPEAEARLRGSFLGRDGTTSCAIVVMTFAGSDNRHQALRILRDFATVECGVPESDLHVAGTLVDAVFVDRESAKAMAIFAPLSGLLILILSAWCLRSVWVALAVFLMSVYCVGVAQCLVYYQGDVMNAVMIVLPPLVLVVGVAGGVHLVNYYYDAVETHGIDGAPRRAMELGWIPCTLAAGTTAIGLASLLVSGMTPVWMFGKYGALGVLATLVLLLLLLPGALELIRPRYVERVGPDNDNGDEVVPPPGSGQERLGDWLWRRGIGRLLLGYHGTITVIAFALMIGLGIGTMWIQTSVKLRTLFRPDSEIIRDYAWLEDRLSGMIPIEVLVQFPLPNDASMTLLDRLTFVKELQQELSKLEAVNATVSALDYAPSLHRPEGLLTALRTNTIVEVLDRRREVFEAMKLLRETDDAQIWRVTARVSALSDIDYGEFIDEVRLRIEPLIDRANERLTIDRILAPLGPQRGLQAHLIARARAAMVEQHPPAQSVRSISAVYSGVMPLVHKSQRELLNDLFRSFLWALAAVTLVMIAVQGYFVGVEARQAGFSIAAATGLGLQRGLLNGLVAMAPNVFPMVLLFGWMGWMRYPMDIGSVMTASVALGMAFDGNMHFLTFVRRGLEQGHSVPRAARLAFHQCAGALVQSALICGLGLFPFVLSPFVPTSRFAYMLAGLLATALIGQLLVLPSLLLGPLGKLFSPPKKPSVARPPEDADGRPTPKQKRAASQARTS